MLRIQELGDLELAVLLSLVARQHCIITTDNNFLSKLAQELRLIATRVFPLSCVVVDCSPSTSLDDFREAVLVDCPLQPDESPTIPTPHLSLPSFQYKASGQSEFRNNSGLSNSLDERRVADVVVVKDLNLASHNVQTQALELIRTRRLFSHTAMHGASEDFLFISLQSAGSTKLSRHLNDLFAISHYHFPADGFPNYEEASTAGDFDPDKCSLTSALGYRVDQGLPLVSHADIDHLRSSSADVRMTAEVSAYLHNVTIFLRLSRYVAGGVSALATSHLRSVTKALAPLHNLSYCPPSLVALAAKKIYPHRIVLANAKNERSLQWGSDSKAVREVLNGITVEDAIEAVLESVEAPL